jgi:hypothetical protein
MATKEGKFRLQKRLRTIRKSFANRFFTQSQQFMHSLHNSLFVASLVLDIFMREMHSLQNNLLNDLGAIDP